MHIAHFDTIAELADKVGQPIYESEWVEITQRMIDQFAEATGDHNWVHVDVERARRESPYGCTIAHGHLTAALIARFAQESVLIADKKRGLNYGSNRVRYLTPVKVGSRVRGKATLASFEEIEGGAQLGWNTIVEIEGEERPACIAETLTRAYR